MLRQLRERIDTLFRTNADFDAFCIDEFPTVNRRFSAGMDRVEKINLLLTLIDETLIQQKLDERDLVGAQPREIAARPGAAPQRPPQAPAAQLATEELSLQHIKRACARLTADSLQGTGYLVRADRLVTCAHVVGKIAVGGTVEASFYDEAVPVQATLEHLDHNQDWAVLRLAQPISDRLPLPSIGDARAESRWVAFGFPTEAGPQGVALGGSVRDELSKVQDGAAAVQLFCEEAAAARGALLHGASGSPVISRGHVIGHLRRILPDEEDRAQMGMVFACPASAFAGMLSPAPVQPSFRAYSPQTGYDPLWHVSRRDAELLALNKLRDPGVPVTLQAPEGYGKAWLVNHLLDRIRQQDLGSGQRTEVIRFNLRKNMHGPIASLEELLMALLQTAFEHLSIERSDGILSRVAKGQGHITRRFRRALEQHVLSRPAARILLLIEEGDQIHGLPMETEFFSLLRSLAEDKTPPYRRLRLLVTVAAEAGLLENTNHSAFFGLSPPIVLDGFTREQLRLLASQYGLSPTDTGLDALHRLTAGQPFFSRVALYEAISSELTLTQLLERVDARGGLFAASLQRLRRQLDAEGLLTEVSAVLQNPRHKVPFERFIALYRKGVLFEPSPGEYRLRSRLLEDYFHALCRP